jgi:hypothetical protein
VLDIILDDAHPLFNKEIPNIIIPSEFPINFKDNVPPASDKNYGDIGLTLIRLCHSQQGVANQDLVRAYPLERDCTSYPLLNEAVGVIKYLGAYYYTNKINFRGRGFTNTAADFRLEQTYGFNTENRGVLNDAGNIVGLISGPESKLDSQKDSVNNAPFRGILGKYFWFNNKIRNLRRFEGDTIVESRFGQSIRFGAYDTTRINDIGDYDDYKNPEKDDKKKTNPFSKTIEGGGNPMILIRNRQRPIVRDESIIKNNERNVGGYIEENINNDGSSIHITSGLTISKFVTVIGKSYFSINKPEEQPAFSPKGCTTFKFPTLKGDQIVINSDRLLFQSRAQETIHFSKKRYMISTDDEYTVDAQKQIVMTTNQKTVINSPAIYLGEYNNTNEPAILGQTCVNWLYDLCNWLLLHTHWHPHTHPDDGQPSPPATTEPVQVKELKALRDKLHTLLSRRVFLTGGGYAPGFNGPAPDSVKITNIDGELSPQGIPGGWTGRSRRITGIIGADPAVGAIVTKMSGDLQAIIAANIETMSEAELTQALEGLIDDSLV